jgi:hypothetical protein
VGRKGVRGYGSTQQVFSSHLFVTGMPYSRDLYFPFFREETPIFLTRLGRGSHVAAESWGKNLDICFLIRLSAVLLALVLPLSIFQEYLFNQFLSCLQGFPSEKFSWFLAFPIAGFGPSSVRAAKAVITCPYVFQLLHFFFHIFETRCVARLTQNS